jgi:hypothetical protein
LAIQVLMKETHVRGGGCASKKPPGPRLGPSAIKQTANEPRVANMVSENEAPPKDQTTPRGITARTADIKLTGNPLLELARTVAPRVPEELERLLKQHRLPAC